MASDATPEKDTEERAGERRDQVEKLAAPAPAKNDDVKDQRVSSKETSREGPRTVLLRQQFNLSSDMAAHCRAMRRIAQKHPTDLTGVYVYLFKPDFNCWRRALIKDYRADHKPRQGNPKSASGKTASDRVKRFLREVQSQDDPMKE